MGWGKGVGGGGGGGGGGEGGGGEVILKWNIAVIWVKKMVES